MARGLDILIRDALSGDIVDRCVGPDDDGSCPRAATGWTVPCAGRVIVPAEHAGALSFGVPPHSTMCPVEVAFALAGASELQPVG